MTKEEREIRNQQIVELAKIKSQKEIGEIFNLSQTQVGNILKKFGIKLPKSRLNMSKLDLDTEYFKEINSPQKAYWLGFICADGCIYKNGGKLTILVKDKEICKKFKKDIRSEHKILERQVYDKRTSKTYIQYSIQITNSIFVSHIINKGVTSQKSSILTFPSIEEQYYSYFIAGLFDGDGSISFKASGKVACNLISTKEVLNFIQNYLFNKYGIAQKSLIKVSENCSNVYKIYWQNDIDCLKFLNFIYQGDKNIYLERKYERYERYKQGGELQEVRLPLTSMEY